MSSFLRWKCTFGLLPLVLLCSSTTPALRAQQPASPNTPKPEEKLTQSLSREIRHQIRVLHYYSVFDFLSFTLDGGKVIITGQVLRPTLKTDAGAAVRSLEGVASVTNLVEVLPPSPTDDELRRALYRAIYEDPTLARYAQELDPPIHMIVKNGKVTLEGSLSNAADKNLAELRARSVSNVLGVKNNLVIQPKGSAAE